MKRPAHFRSLKRSFERFQTARAKLQAEANAAQRLAKRAIFALHRDDLSEAKKRLSEAETLFAGMRRAQARVPRLDEEGSYRASLEEYAEAVLFLQALTEGKFGELPKEAMNPNTYFGGLADACGELVRYARGAITRGDVERLEELHGLVQLAVTFFLDMDLTGYLRTKADQAKKHLRAIEQMRYDVAIRDRGV